MSIPVPRNLFPDADLTARIAPNGLRGAHGARPCFDYKLIRIEGGLLDYSRTFFAHPTRSR
jgi:hypothetical protein